MRRSIGSLWALAACLLGAGACSEEFAGGAACPALCPESEFAIRDTVIFPIGFDTTVSGYPPLGAETQLRLADRRGGGDTIVVGAVARFDSVSTRFRPSSTDTPTVVIAALDSARLRLTLLRDSITDRDTASLARVTFEIYDVDANASDFDPDAVRALFRGDRLLGQRTVRRDSLKDSVSIALEAGRILPKVQGGSRVRLGIRIRSDSSMQIPVSSAENLSGGPQLRLFARAGSDTGTVVVAVNTRSSGQDGTTLPNLFDYSIVLRGTPPPPPMLLAAGGLPANRAYLRFALPSRIVDSTTVVRASLVLTQAANPSIDDTLSVLLVPRLVVAKAALNAEPGKAALLLADEGLLRQRAIRLQPVMLRAGNAGQVRIELVDIVRFWRVSDESEQPRALVLQSGTEGVLPVELLFYSSEASDLLRPRLELSYVPRLDFVLP